MYPRGDVLLTWRPVWRRQWRPGLAPSGDGYAPSMESSGHAGPRHLSDVVKAGDVAMVTTRGRLGQRSRPLTVAGVEGDTVSFLVSDSADWVHDHQPGTETECTVSEPSDNHYVAVSGESSLVADQDRIQELWSAPAGAFFDGPDDPALRVLEVAVTDGQWWEGPDTRAGTLVAMVRSAIGRDDSAMGQEGTVTTRSS